MDTQSKCFKYCPDAGTEVTHGPIRVVAGDETDLGSHIRRTFTMHWVRRVRDPPGGSTWGR